MQNGSSRIGPRDNVGSTAVCGRLTNNNVRRPAPNPVNIVAVFILLSLIDARRLDRTSYI